VRPLNELGHTALEVRKRKEEQEFICQVNSSTWKNFADRNLEKKERRKRKEKKYCYSSKI